MRCGESFPQNGELLAKGEEGEREVSSVRRKNSTRAALCKDVQAELEGAPMENRVMRAVTGRETWNMRKTRETRKA